MKALHIFTLFTTADSFFNGQFRYLVENGHHIEVACQNDDVDRFCSFNKVKFHPIDISRSISPFADIRTIISVFKLIRKEKYDAVFGHTPKGAMIAMIAAVLAGVKTRIYYRHGLIYTTAYGIKRRILKIVEQITSLFSTQIINVSKSLSRLAVEDYLNSDKKQIIIGHGTCGGIDAKQVFNPSLVSPDDTAALKRKYKIDNEDLVVGFCGRICNEKGIRELIDGFNMFRLAHPEISIKLLLVGRHDSRDPLSDNYMAIIQEDNDIISTGKIVQSELPKFYSLMDLFVFPSYREGFGMCVIEAAAMEVPAIVSRSHGCVDSIIEHKTGEYIDIDAKSVAAGITNMMDSNMRKIMGKKARTEVLQKYDHSIMWPLVLNVYNALQVK